DPDPIPATIPMRSAGKIREPTRRDMTTKPSAMNVDQVNRAIATTQELVSVMKAVGRERIVSRTKIRTGRSSLAANRSATQPQKKYPISHPTIGIHKTLPNWAWVKPSARFRYSGLKYAATPSAKPPNPKLETMIHSR